MNKRVSCSILVALWVAVGQSFPLTIFHVNDTHSRIEPATVSKKPYGGMARLATKAKEIRREYKNTLFLHAGDAFQGTLYYNVYKGSADGVFLNMLGIDAMTLGNHEFDDGPANLTPFVEAAQFPIVCANMDFSADPGLAAKVKPWTTLKVGKEKIGVVGLMTPDLPSITGYADQVRMLDLDASLNSAIAAMKEAKINKIILLSHCGYDVDQVIAKNHPDLDVIVGGHSHSYLGTLKIEGFPEPMGAYPTRVGSTLIVQAWEWAKIAGLLQVDFDRSGTITKVIKAETIPIDESITPDPQVQGAINAFAKPISSLQQAVVGDTKMGLPRTGDEYAIGNVIADAQLAYTKDQGTVICMMNRGGVRAAIEPGEITYGEAISVQPFGNTLVILDLTGAEIWETLETGVTGDKLLQVSKGLRYEVDFKKPEGSRVTNVTLNGQTLDKTKVYRCVVNNFMSKGGDGFLALKNAKGYRYDTGNLDIDALIAYIKANQPLEAKPEGRIVIRR